MIPESRGGQYDGLENRRKALTNCQPVRSIKLRAALGLPQLLPADRLLYHSVDTRRERGAMGGLLLVVMASVLAGVPLAVKLKRTRRPTAALLESPALPALVNRRIAGWRWAGVIGGMAAGGAAAASGALGRGLLLAAPVFGLCVLAGVVVGETSVRSPTGRTRMAALEVRRVRDYLPRGLAGAVVSRRSAPAGSAHRDYRHRSGRRRWPVGQDPVTAVHQHPAAGRWPVAGVLLQHAARGTGGHRCGCGWRRPADRCPAAADPARIRRRSRQMTLCGDAPRGQSPAPAASW